MVFRILKKKQKLDLKKKKFKFKFYTILAFFLNILQKIYIFAQSKKSKHHLMS